MSTNSHTLNKSNKAIINDVSVAGLVRAMFYVQLRPPPPIKMDGRGRSVACFHGIFTPYYRLSFPIHCISEEPAERIGVGGMSTSAAGTHLSAVLDSAQQGRLDSEPRAPRRDRWMGPEQRSGVQVGAWAASAGVAVVVDMDVFDLCSVREHPGVAEPAHAGGAMAGAGRGWRRWPAPWPCRAAQRGCLAG